MRKPVARNRSPLLVLTDRRTLVLISRRESVEGFFGADEDVCANEGGGGQRLFAHLVLCQDDQGVCGGIDNGDDAVLGNKIDAAVRGDRGGIVVACGVEALVLVD